MRDRPDTQEMQAELNALREELRRQWEYNHSERCGEMPACHVGECHWPMPEVLRRGFLAGVSASLTSASTLMRLPQKMISCVVGKGLYTVKGYLPW